MKKTTSEKERENIHLRCSPSRAAGSPRSGTACRRGRRARPRSPGGLGRRAGRSTFCLSILFFGFRPRGRRREAMFLMASSSSSSQPPFPARVAPAFPSDECKRWFSTRSREGSKKEAPSPPRERQKRNKSDRHRVSFLFFFVRQVLSLALLTFLFAVPESFRSRVVLSSENQTQCVPPLSCRAALSAVRSLSSAPPPPQRDVRSRCSGSDDRICL